MPDDVFESRISPWRPWALVGLAVFVGVVLVGLIVQVLSQHQPHPGRHLLLPVLSLIACGVGLAAAARKVMDRRPQLTVGRDGVDFRAWRLGVVPWAAVERVSVVHRVGNQRHSPVLVLHLTDPDPWLARLPAMQRSVQRMVTGKRPSAEAGHLAIPFTGLSPGLMPAVEFIVDRLGMPVDDQNA